jgi:hypothetical protein
MRLFLQLLVAVWIFWAVSIAGAFWFPKKVAEVFGPVFLKITTILLLLATLCYFLGRTYQQGMKRLH